MAPVEYYNNGTALLFSGQGSQYVGMGQSLYEQFPQALNVFDTAELILGYSIASICFNGPDELLRQTRYTQPALFVHEVSILSVVGNIRCSAVAGHSLGEYTALYAAGVLSFDDALKLVALRGDLMYRSGLDVPGTMAAVIGLEDEQVERICQEYHDVVVAANFNSPGQVVISGERNAVLESLPRFKQAGARIATELPVSGAFHSPLMEPARVELAHAIAACVMKSPICPLYMNVTGEAVQDVEEIRNLLVKQLTSPVRWTTIIKAMHSDGINRFVEIGPKNVLQGLVRRTLGNNVDVFGIDTADDVHRYHNTLLNPNESRE